MPLRVAAFAATAFAIHAVHTAWLTRIQPGLSTALAVRQLNGTGPDADALRWLESEKNLVSLAAASAVAVAGLALFARPALRLWSLRPRRVRALLPLLGAATLLGGCVKPYDTPEFASIDTAETGFLIPLEGGTKDRRSLPAKTTCANSRSPRSACKSRIAGARPVA